MKSRRIVLQGVWVYEGGGDHVPALRQTRQHATVLVRTGLCG